MTAMNDLKARRNAFFAKFAEQQRDSDQKREEALPRRMPLTDAQQRLWFLYQLHPQASCAYDITMAFRLHGMLDHNALQRSLDALMQRHESLRVIIREKDGIPAQEFTPAATSFPLQLEDISSLPASAREILINEIPKREKGRPFLLDGQLLVRAVLVTLSAQDHVLVVKKSHLISDGWSVDVFLSELSQIYSAFADGTSANLPEITRHFSEYVDRNNGWQSSPDCDRQIAYWVEKLRDSEADLGLPKRAGSDLGEPFTGCRLPIKFDDATGDKVKAFAARLGTTPFAVLLGSWALLLSAYGGRSNLTIGVPVANRAHYDLRGTIGFFVNTVALRLEIESSLTVPSFMRIVGETVVDSLDYQSAPFGEVVNRLGRGAGRADVLFQTMFALETQVKNVALKGLRASPIEIPHVFSDHDISLDLMLSSDREKSELSGAITYATRAFDQDTISGMAECLVHLIERVVNSDESRISELDIVPDLQKARLLSFNPDTLPITHALAHSKFEEHARATPDKIALDGSSGKLTYARLNELAEHLADHLAQKGIGPGDRVVLHLRRDLSVIVAILAVLKVGAAYVPLDRVYPADRKQIILEDSQPACVIRDEESPLPNSTLDELLINFDGTVPAAATVAGSRQRHVRPEDLAYRIYTSGTTGRPKGVDISHSNLCTLIAGMTWATKLTSDDRVLQFASFSFDQSVEDTFITLSAGATLVIRPEHLRAPDRDFREFLENKAISYMSLPTGFWHQWTQEIAAGYAIPNAPLRLVAVGGEKALSRSVAIWFQCEQLAGCPLLNTYGPTEATVTAMIHAISEQDVHRNEIPIGQPIPGFQVFVVDRWGRLAPYGALGELCIGGAAVGQGYANRPEQTEQAFVSNPFVSDVNARLYRTGDIVRWIEPGRLGYVGRRDEQVKFRGFRVELPEIEACLATHPSVLQSIVLVQKNEAKPDQLIAFVVQKEGLQVPAKALRDHLLLSLPDFMIPDSIASLDRMPLSTNGKVDRKALVERDVVIEARRTESAPPQGELEVAIANIWSDLLGNVQIGRDDDFFQLGGHSLLAIRFISRFRLQTQRELTLAQMIGAPTVAKLALQLSQTSDEVAQLITQISQGRGGRPIFGIHAIDGEIGYLQRLAPHLPDDRPLYGISAPGLSSGAVPLTKIEQFVDLYLAAIRRHQPSGPYSLLGWSAGGTLAWAIAERLHRDGEIVDVLGLIDTVAQYQSPEASTNTHDLLEARHPGLETIASLARNQAGVSELWRAAEELPADSAHELLVMAQINGCIPAGISWDMVLRFQRVRDGIFNAIRKFKPRSSDVGDMAVHLFTASFPICEDLGWRSIYPPTKVEEIGGSHFSIVEAPHLNRLGAALAAAMTGSSSVKFPNTEVRKWTVSQ